MVKTLAIDINADSIRVMEGEVKKKTLLVYDGFELAPPKLNNGEVESFEEITETLLEHLGEKNGKNQPVNILFPSKTIQHHLMQIPIVDEKALKKSIPAQIQQHFGTKEKPLSTLTHCMDYAIYGIVESEKNRLLSVLMTVMGKDVALRCMEPFNEYKFQVKVLDSPINNLFYVSEMSRRKKEPIDVVIQLLNLETNLLFLQKSKPIYHRSLKFGIQNLLKDRDGFFNQIIRTVETVRAEHKVLSNNILLVGDVSRFFGVTGSFREVFSLQSKETQIEDWFLQAESVYSNACITIENHSEMDFDSSYATTLGLLAREVL